MNGRMEVTAVRITPEVVDPKDIDLLQDLIKSAFIDGSEKVKEALKQEMGSLTGGMGLPPGFMGNVDGTRSESPGSPFLPITRGG